MKLHDSLVQIREPWLERVSQNLARGEGVRQVFLDQLNRFYDLLLQAVESGDPGWLNPVLTEWAEARTESELKDEDTAVSPILSQIAQQTLIVAQEELETEGSLLLVNALMPIFTYAYERSGQQETMLRVAFLSSELEDARIQLDRLDRSKSNFIAVSAHELKTPLTLIQGYATMLHDEIQDKPEGEDMRTLIQGIENGTRRLQHIVDDLIDVSLIDNQELALKFQPCWMNRLFVILEDDLAPVAEERKQSLTFHEFEGCDQMTYADPERLYQALRNVIANAIKYTPNGGDISVDGRLLSGFIEVTVKDSGIGIEPEYQEQIFEKFGRLGNPILHSSGRSKFKGGGPGLGLSISKGIMEAHGGSIWVESSGQDEVEMPGSTFHLLLPLLAEPPGDTLSNVQPLEADQ
ncbi:MAG: hypothetical protein DWQ07_01965 [Chloroflexi bacterium]|nr:MAG: hypothetical protein DWQ07_01965 [Chloroflexota bacterium]MBL1193735.1 hypothetical protein [Chloroflexota bacterium]NOH11028.1 hypothetical protein [Chloroflexota bacterium]